MSWLLCDLLSRVSHFLLAHRGQANQRSSSLVLLRGDADRKLVGYLYRYAGGAQVPRARRPRVVAPVVTRR